MPLPIHKDQRLTNSHIINQVALSRNNFGFPDYMLLILLSSSFGPYITDILRADMLFLYVTFFLFGLRGYFSGFSSNIPLLATPAYLFSIITAIAMFMTVLRGIEFNIDVIRQMQLMVYFTAAPISLISLSVIVLKAGRVTKSTFFFFFDLLILFNSTVTLLNLLFGYIDYIPYFTKFDLLEVGGLSGVFMDGRVSGIFSQPFEAGIAYSLWAISVVCRMKVGFGINPSLKTVYSSVMWINVIAAMFSVSKVFLFIGVPLSVILYFVVGSRTRSYSRGVSLKALSMPMFLFFIGGVIYFLPGQSTKMDRSLERITSLFSELTSGDRFVEVATGGRIIESGSSLNQFWVDRTSEMSPMFGMGVGEIMPLDSVMVAIYAQTGAIGLVLYCISLLSLIILCVRYSKSVYSWFLGGVIALIILSGIGGPALVIGRISILLWFFLAFYSILAATERNPNWKWNRMNA